MTILADHMEDERTARMALSMIAEPDDAVTGRVLALVSAVETVRLIESEDIVPFLDRVDAMIWRESLNPRVDDHLLPALDQARQSGFGVLIPSDVDWPAGVNDLHEHAPYVLWTLGDEALLSKRPRDLVTITGSRAATTYGERVAGEFATDFAASGRVVVAGGTYGIEGAAHRGALARDGSTVAVLAGGLDRPYPAGHRGLLERIGDAGLLVSELPPGATPTRHRFAARSRLMAAMAGATVCWSRRAADRRRWVPLATPVAWVASWALCPAPSRPRPASARTSSSPRTRPRSPVTHSRSSTLSRRDRRALVPN